MTDPGSESADEWVGGTANETASDVIDGGNMQPLIHRIPIAVDTRDPDGLTHAYLVDGLLIDPAGRSPAIDAAAAADSVTAIAVTHTHHDHVGAVAQYAAETDATVYAHAAHIDRFREATGIEPDRTIQDGDPVGDRSVVVMATPGHAPDHLAFTVDLPTDGADEQANDTDRCVGITGDLVVNSGSVVVGGSGGDMRAYLDSLERIRDHGFTHLYPAHGPVIADPVATCQRLIDHRLDRERAVLEAVATGANTIADIVAAAYEKDLTGVEDLARATVIAHLEALISAGRIVSLPDVEGWRVSTTGRTRESPDDAAPFDEGE